MQTPDRTEWVAARRYNGPLFVSSRGRPAAEADGVNSPRQPLAAGGNPDRTAIRGVRPHMAHRTVLFVFTVLLAAGCSSSPVAPTDIVGTRWQLVTIQGIGRPAVAVADPARYQVEFDGNDRITVRADCNSCGGRYSLNSPQLRVGPLACTRVACAPGSLDQTFTAALSDATTVAIEDGQLAIRGGGGALKFRN
jgi:heat shock protein HslJ